MVKKHQNLARLGRIGELQGLGTQRLVEGDLGTRPRGPRRLETASQWERDAAELVGRQRAREAAKLMAQGIVGTLPELCTYVWLESRKWSFTFQSEIMGGRQRIGGAVADFILYDLRPDGLVVWRVQGEYWHGAPERKDMDQQQKDRLMQAWYMGSRVVAVTDLWELDIYEQMPEVFEAAEGGEELR